MPLQPTLQEVIAEAIESRLLELHTCTVGQVHSYNAATQRALVYPLIRRVDLNNDVPEEGRLYTSLPLLHNIPVVWPRGGGYALHFPLKAGDHVLLVFADSDTAFWQVRPKADVDPNKPNAEFGAGYCEPQDLRRHSMGSPFAIAGVFPDKHPIADAPTDHAVLIVPAGGKLRVSTAGAGHVELVALAEKVAAQLTALKQAIAGAAVAPLDGGAAFKAAIIAALADWPGDVASSKLEAE